MCWRCPERHLAKLLFESLRAEISIKCTSWRLTISNPPEPLGSRLRLVSSLSPDLLGQDEQTFGHIPAVDQKIVAIRLFAIVHPSERYKSAVKHFDEVIPFQYSRFLHPVQFVKEKHDTL